DIKEKIEEGKAVNEGMKKVKEEVGEKDGVDGKSDYRNEDCAEKDGYNNGVKEGEEIINKR
ncbi:FIVAR domain-containing protein, partial [Staphylococcus epidermidis]|uniref:FIVAR domain-containing protein n=1 Tax=Staphylococcus epidermidis TaxID=1282 RepID=UPI0016433B7F